MSQLEHHLPGWLNAAFPPTSYTLDSWVRFRKFNRTVDHCFLFDWIAFLSGGDKGSGSEWFYDGGKLVRRSMMIGKPLIVVTCK